MLCMLDNFIFESSITGLNSIKRTATYDFENTKLINAHDDWQATARFSKTITLAGKLVKKSVVALDDLEQIAQEKEVVILSFEDGKAAGVLILDIETEQSKFLNNGAFLSQDFQVTLEVVHGSI